MSIKHLRSKGETIVEVLLAMTIVGFALGIAYGTASRSQQVARQAQERGRATKIVEGQLEELKSLAGTKSPPIFVTANAFCLASDLSIVNLPAGTPTADLTSDNFNKYTGCQTGFYNYSVSYDKVAGDVFTVRARWNRIGSGRDEVSIVYKLHPE